MFTMLLTHWTGWVVRNATIVLLTLGGLTGIAAWVAVTQFQMNSDTSRLIRQETTWKQTFDAFRDTFPQYHQNTYVVVSGTQPDRVRQVTRAAADHLRQRGDVFSEVYSPATGAFADKHALLFLTPGQLNDTISRLAQAQPFLGAIAGGNSLVPAIDLISTSLGSDVALPGGFTQMSRSLSIAADQALVGDNTPIAWRDELFQVAEDTTFYQVIFIQGQQNFGTDLPNATLIRSLETSLSNLQHPYLTDVEIRLTGQVPLEHGEIVSAMNSAQLAGSLALVILVGVLLWGVRSLRIIAATYLSMIVGLIWTAAFAMLTVGQYNTISIIFLVMFIGLGVDFAVHLCLRYQESLMGQDKTAALIETGAELGPAIVLCGITSAMGFLAFVPTDYIGLAEMGIISGGGMLIAVVISLTLIPAFFAVVKEPAKPTGLPLASFMAGSVAENPKTTAYFTLSIAVVLTVMSTQATFDYSTLSLKDPESEAMTTLRELQAEGIATDYSLTWVAPSLEAATVKRDTLLNLDTVGDVQTPLQFLPGDQQEKLFLLQDAGFLLDVLFLDTQPAEADTPPNNTLHGDGVLALKLQQLLTDLDLRLTDERLSDELQASLTSLKRAIVAMHQSDAETRARWTGLIVPPIQAEIVWLQTALGADPVTLESLPLATRNRLLNEQGKALVSITPAIDIVPVEGLRAFTEQVLSVVPDATGRPVLDLGIGDIVVKAFITAIAIAVTCIFVILLITLRSVTDAVLVFIPLLMTAMVTLSVSVLIDLPLNMANVVVIPLIFGLGVDNGIHIVKRFHQCQSVRQLVESSTPKAVFLSNLTTLGTFCALSFSTHQGIYSIGVLLTVALTSLMLLTLIALPALLATFSRPRQAALPVT